MYETQNARKKESEKYQTRQVEHKVTVERKHMKRGWEERTFSYRNWMNAAGWLVACLVGRSMVHFPFCSRTTHKLFCIRLLALCVLFLQKHKKNMAKGGRPCHLSPSMPCHAIPLPIYAPAHSLFFCWLQEGAAAKKPPRMHKPLGAKKNKWGCVWFFSIFDLVVSSS